MRTDEEDQRVRSTKKSKMNDGNIQFSDMDTGVRDHDNAWRTEMHIENEGATIFQEKKSEEFVSYKNKLLGINGIEDKYTSDEPESWSDENESDNDLQEMDETPNGSPLSLYSSDY